MGNSKNMYRSNGSYCEIKADLEDWHTKYTPDHRWDDSDLFFTLKECCVAKHWYDIEGCIEASPKEINFSFSIEIGHIVEPGSCQDADTMAHGLETAINNGLSFIYGNHALSTITGIGCATLLLNDDTHSTECGGCLEGLSHHEQRPHYDSTLTSTTVTASISAKDHCSDSACLLLLYESAVADLKAFIDSGNLAIETIKYAGNRKELLNIQVVSSSFSTSGEYTDPFEEELNTSNPSNLWYPSFDLNEGTNKCVNDGLEELYMQANPTDYLFSNQEECCNQWYWYNPNCADKDTGPSTTLDHTGSVVSSHMKFYPNHFTGLCGQKSDFESWERDQYDSIEECCSDKLLYNYANCCAAGGGCQSSGTIVYIPDWSTSTCTSRSESSLASWEKTNAHSSSSECCTKVFQWNFRECCNAGGGCH